MGRRSSFTIAKKSIAEYFNFLKHKSFSFITLREIFESNRAKWKLPLSWNAYTFRDALEQHFDQFDSVSLTFPTRSVEVLTWGGANANQIALGLRKRSYLSHYSAGLIHGLTDQIPKTIYVSVERATPSRKGTLSQKGIDHAFAKQQRISSNIALFNSQLSICMLEGMHTGNSGITRIEGIRTTGLERTLIDAAVRPIYFGGVDEVIEAYIRAKDILSINKITALLRKMNYTYPYHQAIGFYLELVGLDLRQTELWREFSRDFDFYLTYDMKDPLYSSEWKIYYPKGIII